MILCVIPLLLIPRAYSVLQTESVVDLRWDFSDCKKSGRFGPTQVSRRGTVYKQFYFCNMSLLFQNHVKHLKTFFVFLL